MEIRGKKVIFGNGFWFLILLGNQNCENNSLIYGRHTIFFLILNLDFVSKRDINSDFRIPFQLLVNKHTVRITIKAEIWEEKNVILPWRNNPMRIGIDCFHQIYCWNSEIPRAPFFLFNSILQFASNNYYKENRSKFCLDSFIKTELECLD